MDFQFQPIGVIHSCFKEKFGIPRQPGVVTEARSSLELYPPYDCHEALIALEGFSHIWLVFVFHQAIRKGAESVSWKPTVRPPRLGGNQRIGVFASRSPFRPNPIGLSAVALEGIDCGDGHCVLRLRGADLLDGTPVLDIKPYVPYADALPTAQGGYANEAPRPLLKVSFSETAARQCAEREAAGCPGLRTLIEQVLGMDPRPAYVAGTDSEQAAGRQYGMHLYDFDLQWVVKDGQALVTALVSR